MPAPLKLKGQRFGRLVVLERDGKTSYGAVAWRCVCDCGQESVVAASSLTTGNTSSCGCLMRESIAQQGRAKRTHGMSGTPEHNAWNEMHRRCSDPGRESYPHYGGRGISVCVRWKRFENFLADLGRKPSPKHSLGRIDVNGQYEPGNVRWETGYEQGLNRRNNRIVEAFGRKAPLKQFIPGGIYSKHYKTASAKIRKGHDPEKVLAAILLELAGGENGYC